jgi:hypothetical protein
MEGTMRKSLGLSLALGLGLVGAWPTSATDYWDASVTTDNDPISTFNEFHHGVSQQHDLQANPGPVADEDWYYEFTAPRSSYEVVIDSASADVAMGNTALQRIDGAGTTVIQSSEAASVGATVGTSRALRWQNPNATFTLNYLRVRSGGCTTDCGSAAQYHIRIYETGIAVPRFNNAGSQVTVLLIQNTTSWTRDIAGTVYFWSVTGTLLGTSTFSLAAHAALVLNTAAVMGPAGQGGTITIAHDGGYGGLVVKSVALEPATGFSFDSPGVYKPL